LFFCGVKSFVLVYHKKNPGLFRPGLYVDCLFLLGFCKYNPVYFGKKVIEEKVKKVAVCAFCVHCEPKVTINKYKANFFEKK